ncbi:hypothetical protein E2C01_049977 [Portunus trituberculatus]|uniref:Uncharacterized protein n=1 Tax=Portunus trituberculatus TaxID=210409 RepID=A0A5B7GG05_PORTR|nr:hypothetical protein [Portunus trituberculatus]
MNKWNIKGYHRRQKKRDEEEILRGLDINS